jgi:hypothetical protein
LNHYIENKTVFICIGAQKAGTTWLHEALSNYEDLALPHIKELHYFDVKWLPRQLNPYKIRKVWTKELKAISQNIADTLQNAMVNNIKNNEISTIFSDNFLEKYELSKRCDRVINLANVLSIKNDEDYLNYMMKIGKNKSVLGEITPAYSMLPYDGFLNIKNIFPNVKIIFIMRDPIDRFISQMKFVNKQRKTKGKDGIDIKEEYLSMLKDDKFLKRANYQDILYKIEQVFLKENILLLFYEDLLGNFCVSSMHSIEIFLNLPKKTDEEILSWKNKTYNETADLSNIDNEKQNIAQNLKGIYEYIFKRFDRVPQKWIDNYEKYCT